MLEYTQSGHILLFPHSPWRWRLHWKHAGWNTFHVHLRQTTTGKVLRKSPRDSNPQSVVFHTAFNSINSTRRKKLVLHLRFGFRQASLKLAGDYLLILKHSAVNFPNFINKRKYTCWALYLMSCFLVSEHSDIFDVGWSIHHCNNWRIRTN